MTRELRTQLRVPGGRSRSFFAILARFFISAVKIAKANLRPLGQVTYPDNALAKFNVPVFTTSFVQEIGDFLPFELRKDISFIKGRNAPSHLALTKSRAIS